MLIAGAALADNPVTWSLNETISRTDGELFWTSPNAIDLGFDRYDYDYEITRIRANSIDVTQQIGESFDLIGMGNAGVLPATLLNQALDDPTTGTSADVLIAVDENGFGQAAFTNVVLGSVPFGPIQIPINTIQVEATISVTGVDFPLGDYTQDGAVDRGDYARWVADYGSTTLLNADGNDDGRVDAADYTVWRDVFDSPVDATAVPEPSGLLVLMASAACPLSRRRKPSRAE